MLDLKILNNTGWETGISPFFSEGEAFAVNFTAGELIIQGSDDNGVVDAWATLVACPAASITKIPDLPKYIRVSTAATLYVLAG